jgi:hypothetical protein
VFSTGAGVETGAAGAPPQAEANKITKIAIAERIYNDLFIVFNSLP